MKKKKTPEKGGNKRTAIDKPSDNEEDPKAENCEICEAIKEGKFSALAADAQNNTPVLNNGTNKSKLIKNGIKHSSLSPTRNYSSYAAKILQLQEKISKQVLYIYIMGISMNNITFLLMLPPPFK